MFLYAGICQAVANNSVKSAAVAALQSKIYVLLRHHSQQFEIKGGEEILRLRREIRDELTACHGYLRHPSNNVWHESRQSGAKRAACNAVGTVVLPLPDVYAHVATGPIQGDLWWLPTLLARGTSMACKILYP